MLRLLGSSKSSVQSPDTSKVAPADVEAKGAASPTSNDPPDNDDPPLELDALEMKQRGPFTFVLNVFYWRGTVFKNLLPQLTLSLLWSVAVVVLRATTSFRGTQPIIFTTFGAFNNFAGCCRGAAVVCGVCCRLGQATAYTMHKLLFVAHVAAQ